MPAAATAHWPGRQLADRLPLLHTRVLVQDRAQSGFGSVLRLGIAYAAGRFCVTLMPDARDPLELIPKMITELRAGLTWCSALGTTGSRCGRQDLPWRFRHLPDGCTSRAIKLLLGVDIPDSTYGFRAFNRTFVQALGISGRRMSVCSEMTFKVCSPARSRRVRCPGRQTGPMVREQSKFRLGERAGRVHDHPHARLAPSASACAGSR